MLQILPISIGIDRMPARGVNFYVRDYVRHARKPSIDSAIRAILGKLRHARRKF
jgi:hypothetical protein